MRTHRFSAPATLPAGLTLRILLALFGILPALAGTAHAQPPPCEKIASRYDFATTVARLEAAVKASPIDIVTRANAQAGARSQGVTLPGNQVWGLYGPQYAVRMLRASVDAGFEAPLRLYLVEAPDGKVTVRYCQPSEVFRPYGSAALDAMARELDAIFAEIVAALR